MLQRKVYFAKRSPIRGDKLQGRMAYRILICWILLSTCLVTSINGGRVRRKSDTPSFNGVCWSPWFSDDNTSLFTPTSLEIETISVIQNVFPNQTCNTPTDIQCRTVDNHIPYNETFENVLCIVEYGLQCRQIRDVVCSDYEIRIACPCNISSEDAVTVAYESTTVESSMLESSATESFAFESTVLEESSTSQSEDTTSDADYAATGFHEKSPGVTPQEDTTAQTTVTLLQPIRTEYDQSTSIQLVTLPGSGEDKCWSPWLDDERLGISTDSSRVETEKITTFRRYDDTLVCSEPERIECRKIVDKTPAGDEVTRCDVTFGLQCVDGKDGDCADYEIRLLCPAPCHPNGTLFTFTSAAPTIEHISEEPVTTVDQGTFITKGNTRTAPTISQSQSSVPTVHVYTHDPEPGTTNPPVIETTISGMISGVPPMRTKDAGQSSSNAPDGITMEIPHNYSSQQTVLKTTVSSKTPSNTPTLSTDGLTTDSEQKLTLALSRQSTLSSAPTIEQRSDEPVTTVDQGTFITKGNTRTAPTIGQSQSSVPDEITTAHVYTHDPEPGTANPPVIETTISGMTSEDPAMRTKDAGQSSSNAPDGITTEIPHNYSSQQTVLKTTVSSKTPSNTPTLSTDGLTTDSEQKLTLEPSRQSTPSSGETTISVTNADTTRPYVDISEGNVVSLPIQTTESILKETTPTDIIVSTPSLPSTELPRGEINTTLPTTPITEDSNVIPRTVEVLTSSGVDVSTDVHNTTISTYKATVDTTNSFTAESYTTAKETLAITRTQGSITLDDLRTTASTPNPSDLSTPKSKNTEHYLHYTLPTETIGRTGRFTRQPETTEELMQTFRLTSTVFIESKTVTELNPLNQGCKSVSCFNDGTCFRKGNNRPKCNCTNGWEGKYCTKDDQAPVIECPANIKRVISSKVDTRYFEWDSPIVTDNDVYHNSTVRSNVSFGTFSVGKVIVEYTAEDFAGNVAKPCTFKIVLFVGCKYNRAANLTWRRVEINNYRSSQEICPEGTPRAGMPKGTRYCGADDDGNAVWMTPVIQDCLQSITPTSKSMKQREEELVNLSEATVTMDNVSEVADELTLLTDGVDEVSQKMFNAIADTLDNIVNVGSTSLEVTEAVFSTVSNLLSADMGDADIATSSTKIVKAVDTQVALAQQGQGGFQVQVENLAVLANTNNHSIVEGGLGFASIKVEGQGDDGESSLENYQLDNFQNANSVPLTGVDVSCKIPEEIGQFIGSGTNSSSTDLQISYVIYSNGMLFSSPLTSGVNSTVAVMSRVLSVSVPDSKVSNLQDPVTMSFEIPPDKSNYEKATCVYWDFTLQDGIGDWSSGGCVMTATNDDVIICNCNHLTHFAVLLEFRKKGVRKDVLFALVLISRVGCLVSIACLMATLIAFLSFRRLRCERPQRILISLSVSLLCLYIMFIIGIEPADPSTRTEPQETKCLVSAALLHYFTLTSVFWMVVEAVNLYYNLIKVFKSKVSLFMLKASIFAWGIPGLIVGGMVGWQTTREYYMNGDYCFMAIGYPFYLSIALPVAVCLLFNLIVFMRVMCELMCRRKQPKNSTENTWKNVSKQVQNAFGISVLLGLTWVFGFLTFNIEHDYIFDVMFCVCNSLQGVFVFMFFCVRQKEVRITWKKFLCCQKQESYNVGSSSVSSTRYTHRSGRPASTNIDLPAKPHNEPMHNVNGSAVIYDYNNATCC